MTCPIRPFEVTCWFSQLTSIVLAPPSFHDEVSAHRAFLWLCLALAPSRSMCIHSLECGGMSQFPVCQARHGSTKHNLTLTYQAPFHHLCTISCATLEEVTYQTSSGLQISSSSMQASIVEEEKFIFLLLSWVLQLGAYKLYWEKTG